MNLAGSDLPFPTSNAALAFALYLAGIPFADDTRPLVNIYYADTLRGMGFKGMSHEAAADMAFAQGRKGHVEYGFQQVPELEECKAAFNNARKAYIAEIGHSVAVTRNAVCVGTLTQPQAIAGLAGVIFQQWEKNLDQWKQTDGYKQEMKWQQAHEADAREHVAQRFLVGSEMGFVAAVMVARKALLGLWRNYPHIVSIRREGRVTKAKNANGNGTTFRGPGSALYSPNAGNDIRKHLRVPTR